MSAGAILPPGTAMGRVRLRVRDLGAALDFYVETLGLREVSRTNGTVALSPTGSPPHLVVLEEDPAVARRPERIPGLYHYAILLPDRLDFARTLLRLFQKRWPFSGFADHGVSEAAYLSDPDGNGIELAADRPRDQWPRRGDAIGMTTLALDVTNLLRLVDGDPSRGMPAETRIGHIHLHVPDLQRAERFYHGELGFDVTTRAYPGALFLAAGDYHHHVAVNTWIQRSTPPKDLAGLIDFQI
ncbi:MAG: VOC family protein, partial [Longimicrobiales bacterium]